MLDPIARHADVCPKALALIDGDRRWTYGELDRAVEGAAEGLRGRGVEAGDRVGIHASRRAETVLLLWALWRRGSVAVPMSTRLPPTTVIQRAQDGACDWLVTGDSAMREQASTTLPTVRPEAVVGDGRERQSTPTLPAERSATILFTSGSTGSPKAVLHSWRNHVYSAKGANANIPLREGDRWGCSLPLYHVGGLSILVRCALRRAAVLLPSPDSPLHESLRRQVTHASLVATQMRRVLREGPEEPPSSLRAVVLGGGPIPESVLREGTGRGWPLHTSYGSTEMASQVTTTDPGASLDDLRTAGRRLPHRRVRIEDEQIMVAGAPLFRGYVTDDGVEDPRTDDGWYPTGDRGRIDAAGRLHVLGRRDRMFVSGGENIQPEEIETVLERLKGVERAVVVPVPHPEYGERPVAFLQGIDRWSAPALREALSETLPGFKVPDAFHSLPALEESSGLKVDRESLRERARKLHPMENPGGAAE